MTHDIKAFIDYILDFADQGIVLALLVTILFLISMVVRKICALARLLTEPRSYYEVIPPARAEVRAETTSQLFKVLHGIDRSRSLLDRLIGYRSRFSFEIIATKHDGIRYIIGCPENVAAMVAQEFKSYMRDARINPVDDPYGLVPQTLRMQIMNFKQQHHFAMPLTPQTQLESYDPLAYLTGNMTNLQDEETVIYQLVLVSRRIPEAASIAQKILTNDEVLTRIMGRRKNPLYALTGTINATLFSIIDGVGTLSNSSSRSSSVQSHDPLAMHRRQVSERLKPSRVLSNFEQEAVEAIHNKLAQPLFQASIRTLVASPSLSSAKERSRRLRTSMSLFSTEQYQAIKSRAILIKAIQYPFRSFLLQRRLPSAFVRSSMILSISEAADLFHFPFHGTNETENIVTSLSKALPAPLSLKNKPVLDVLIGENIYHGVTTPIGLTAHERERHMYVIGGTGNGKTTMLQYMIIQDIHNGKGVAVIDPHGDMTLELLTHIPEARIKDVVYFNPDDRSYPIGLNLLELDESLEGDELLREKDLITESVVSIFRKIFSEEGAGGHRIEYILRNTVQTALTIKGATLFTIYDLLNDKRYLKTIIKTLEDENLRNFWNNEIGKAGDMQKVKMAAGITSKVGRFLFSASAKRILEQPKSTIDFEEILDSSKILICNFSKGLIGEDTSELFGIVVLAKLQLASLKRARQLQSTRIPFYLYVDEFQNFATISFTQMLSESRKYKLFLTMAEQSTSQQDDLNMVNIILANVGTVVSFRTGNPADEQALLPLYRPYVEQGDLANLPTFNFYLRLSAVHSQEPLSGRTIVADEGIQKAEVVITHSRKLYSMKYQNAPPHRDISKLQPESNMPPSSHKKLIPKEH